MDNAMATNVQQQREPPTILNLPAELITQICSYETISPNDIFNLAASNSRLNECIFNEGNSELWKLKYKQKYNDWNTNTFNIDINQQNTWKDELHLRLGIDKAVRNTIEQMRSEYIHYKNIPYHLYPFGAELSKNNQKYQQYVFFAAVNFYKHVKRNQCVEENFNLLYTANEMLTYVCQVYFNYKIKDFQRSLPERQTIERGFHLVSRWWCPPNETPYEALSQFIDKIAITICDKIHLTNPQHPLLMKRDIINFIIENGQSNFNNDLFEKDDALIILNCISKTLFEDMKMMCTCTLRFDCYLLNQVINTGKGSPFVMAVLFESIARRLGLVTRFISSSLNVYIFWISSWPGNRTARVAQFYVDIVNDGIVQETPNHLYEFGLSINRTIPIFDIFWSYSKVIEELFTKKKFMEKHLRDFQRIIKPNNDNAIYTYRSFHQRNEFCPCPLIRSSYEPMAPQHSDESEYLYENWIEIFPLVPKVRGRKNDPKYAIGMMIDVIAKTNSCRDVLSRQGIIVGWKNAANHEMSNSTTYFMLIKPHHYYPLSDHQIPEIEPVKEGRYEKLKRQTKLYNYEFSNIGKFFKSYNSTLCAFEPIDALALRYPDDHAFTVNIMKNTASTSK